MADAAKNGGGGLEDAALKLLKTTLNLPETAFAMKANLPQNEPARLAQWKAHDLYGQIRAARAGAAKFILHDGPPYANGAIHLGHALNKCIKDFIIKTKTMAGFDAPYVPGWDCHGLPIEIKVDEQLGRKKLEMPAISVRRACREYAQKYVDLQRSQFERIGVFGRWSDPYLTMSPGYEATILETFYGFFEQGFVYKGLKPVFWCIHDQTALAEAEVEYEQHTSPSVYVRYRAAADVETLVSLNLAVNEANLPVYAIIWTTTPWTLPASQAIAFNPEMVYVAVKCAGGIYLVAETLLHEVAQRCELKSYTEPERLAAEADILVRLQGARLERIKFQHPFFEREILGVTASYVTAEQGTGLVHTAPAHGVDDFYTGKRYDLPELQYVDNAGRQQNLPAGAWAFAGQTIFESNKAITELLRERGALLSGTFFEHSYPHCWRCHNPVIVRATEQWFIGMETPMPGKENEGAKTFRQAALDAIKTVTWDPAWGQERIANMIATRPDWCISRQRIWGVPIAVFLCNRCHQPLQDAAINRSIVALFKEHSADIWYARTAEELLPAGTTCASCGNAGHDAFRKEMDILDVWFESGASWHAVLDADSALSFPADLYTEGGDQHRGWFHSSLLTAIGLRGQAPYRKVATSGWTLDEQGRAFSKSLGNGVDPVDVAKRLGAEIIRLWVASVDFREDVAASENLMARVADNYRKLRNTLRFLLGNLHDFDPAAHALPFAAMEPLDQYILTRTALLDAKIRKAYDQFEFHRAYHALNEFVNTDLSALYLDVLKDRLYTFAPNAPERRSAQTALWHIVEVLTRLIAPILSFTADEVWDHLPQITGREASVHLAHFSDVAEIVPDATPSLAATWEMLLLKRTEVLAKLEQLRADKIIGKSLEAAVTLLVPKDDTVVARYLAALPELFNVSTVSLHVLSDGEPEDAVSLRVERSSEPKCERCWRYVADVASLPAYPTVCRRCASALAEIGFAPYPASSIPRQEGGL